MLALLGNLRRPEDYLRGEAGVDLPGNVVLQREDARQICALHDAGPRPRANSDCSSQVFRAVFRLSSRNAELAELACHALKPLTARTDSRRCLASLRKSASSLVRTSAGEIGDITPWPRADVAKKLESESDSNRSLHP